MSARKQQLWLWLASLLVLGGVAATLDNPGSLDACYHLHVAQNMAAGRGMVEDLVWNYLDKSDAALALPRPSHLYWMPLTSWLAFLGIVCFGALLTPFAAAQVPFVVLASLLPWLTYRIALSLWKSEPRALFAAVLCLAAPNYLQVWVVPEPVTPFCLAAAGCFLACARARTGMPSYWLLAGLGAGLAHLTRADGALVLLAAVSCAALSGSLAEPRALTALPFSAARALRALSLLGLGYLSVTAPWFARNLSLIGAPLPLSVASTAWLHGYDELFSYETKITAARWFAADGLTLISERAAAALRVLVQFFALFQWVIPPLALLGWLSLRRSGRNLFAACAVYAALLLLSMCVVFPYPAKYGSLFRGAAALLPWMMALVPEGLTRFARAYARLRHGSEALALTVFRGGLLLVMIGVAAIFHVHRLYGVLPQTDRLWNRHLAHYLEVESFLQKQGAAGPVLVVDPPGFTLVTGRPSIVVPSDGPEAVRAAADRYGARWLLLEANVPSLEAALLSAAPLEGFAHARHFRDEMGSRVRLLVRTP